MPNEYPSLFSPAKIGNLTLPNTLAVAPMTRVTATQEGVPTETMRRYYERFSRGGFGLVITEGSFIDEKFSQTYAYQPGLANVEQATGWSPIVDAIHAYGARAVAQIQHAGALSQGNRYRDGTIAPSAVQPRGEQMNFYRGEGPYPTPRQMSDEEIIDVINSFGRAAALAIKNGGFDGVEIHGANGYLLDQFLTDYTNLRHDRWGGNVEGRLSVSVEVAKSVRCAVGEQTPVGIRISQGKVNDFMHRWSETEAGAELIFGTLAQAGVDYIHVTEFEAWKPAFGEEGHSLVSLARKYAPGVAIIANGNLHDPVRALEMLGDGADVIALGRGALSNPDWPHRVSGDMALSTFDRDLLAPIADIKAAEVV
ncbi:NADH:flavin oxidoreductase [Pandoraea eparura]|uniref:NADH:flavin oxidoreductase n=1 Tax=Pandoraea eparura TaxID=2508291 RepID=A0A5E4U7F1_9BURK|nr:NADH:flavin oxidoreductase [Pandoraea eparura]VVD94824.1 NADH:flavin oxidoreductase [Pandoraea eparura]